MSKNEILSKNYCPSCARRKPVNQCHSDECGDCPCSVCKRRARSETCILADVADNYVARDDAKKGGNHAQKAR